MAGLSLIVGLGNPGLKYEETRHNAGFWLLDEIVRDAQCVLRPESRFHGHAARTMLSDRQVWLLKPNTYMNLSGKAVAALARFYKIAVDEILVLHDELDFPAGTIRLKKGGGTGGHNGVTDIRDSIGSKDFQRLRIGIGRPTGGGKVESYVLNRPSRVELDAIMDSVYRARASIPQLVDGKFAEVMNELHSDPKANKQQQKKSSDKSRPDKSLHEQSSKIENEGD